MSLKDMNKFLIECSKDKSEEEIRKYFLDEVFSLIEAMNILFQLDCQGDDCTCNAEQNLYRIIDGVPLR